MCCGVTVGVAQQISQGLLSGTVLCDVTKPDPSRLAGRPLLCNPFGFGTHLLDRVVEHRLGQCPVAAKMAVPAAYLVGEDAATHH